MTEQLSLYKSINALVKKRLKSIQQKHAVVRGTTKPASCCHLANATDLLTTVLWAMAGDNKQIDLWPADPFIRIDPKCNQVVPWSLHTFPENFMQIGPDVFS